MSRSDATESISFKEVRTHNLKGFDLNLPLGKISVVTGVSGSGKSSLVFDTLYGESYRRYVESLSSYARQYLKALPKPDVRDLSNLPPAIAVRQARSQATSRSTVGTATELNDLLRVVFARKSEVICYSCRQKVEKSNTETIGSFILSKRAGEKLLICAPLSKWGKITLKELKSQLEAQGFTRLLVRAEEEGGGYTLVKLGEVKAAALKGAAVVIDRITSEEQQGGRIREAVALALKLGRGLMFVTDQEAWKKSIFSDVLDCPNCGISYVEPSETLFNHNHPLGACGTCQGFGYTSDLDWEKVIPDRSSNLSSKGVIPWNFGKFAAYYSWAKTSAKKAGMDPEKSFDEYTDVEWTWLKKGDGGRFDGIEGFFEYLDSKKYKAHYRIHSARFRNYVICASCSGMRLNAKSLACRIDGKNFGDLGRMSIAGINEWVNSAGLDAGSDRTEDHDGMGIADALEELHSRLRYLLKTGLAYLTLERPSRSLSGGEMQRISMARCLGSALTGSLYCLDEPSSGLHARDTDNLISIVRTLQDQGNTVVLVEHDRQMIEAADFLVELGPKAGHEGGNLVYAGDADGSRVEKVAIVAPKSRTFPKFIELKGATTHNLKNINVRFPVGALTAVCGVSGSGKTSLIQHTLYPAIARQLKQGKERFETAAPGFKSVGPSASVAAHSQIMHVQQADLTRSTRSNIATYLGIMEPVRKLLSTQMQARKHGLAPGAFSFNTAGGRCEGCKGLGVVVEDLSFLGEMEVICPVCEGRRFDDKVLSVTFNGKNMTDILGMTVAEARQFFFELPDVVAVCDAVVEMGLGYITLGQHTSSFSGGEAQRLKLLSVMRDLGRKKPMVLILDEPSTGLSDRDVAVLIGQLRKAAAQGHTVIVVEHHLEILRNADWLVEIGPEAADQGGDLVFEGVPFELQGVKNSVTARYLFPGGKGNDS